MALYKKLLVIIVVAAFIDVAVTTGTKQKMSKSKSKTQSTTSTRTSDMECPECKDCGAGKYKCLDGTCITLNDICDITEHCSDGEDEIGCPVTGCNQLPIPDIGVFQVVDGNSSIGGTADIICPADTETCGNIPITCKSDGKWSDATGISCYNPDDILEGFLAVVQSSQASGVAANVIDGMVNTCSETGADNPAFWEITFKGKRLISRIKFNFKETPATSLKVILGDVVRDILFYAPAETSVFRFPICVQVVRLEATLGEPLKLCEIDFNV